jgi:tRNA modification GTPase
VSRAEGARSVADAVLLVLDRSRPLEAVDLELLERTAGQPRLIAINKIDLPTAWSPNALGKHSSCAISLSLETFEGVGELRPSLRRVFEQRDAARDAAAVTNVRHIALLERALAALRRAIEAVNLSGGALSEEFVLADLQEARSAFDEITGKRTSDDVLKHIFERFCIGK